MKNYMNGRDAFAESGKTREQTASLSQISGICFDLDDTLTLTEKGKKEAYFTIVDTLYPKEERRDQALNYLDGIVKNGEKDRFETCHRIAEELFPDFSRESAEHQRHYNRLIGEYSRLNALYGIRAPEVEGAEKLLKTLKEKGVPVAINTGNPEDIARQIVKGRRWDKYIPLDRVYGTGSVEGVRPYSSEIKIDNLKVFASSIAKETGGEPESALNRIVMVGDGNSDEVAGLEATKGAFVRVVFPGSNYKLPKNNAGRIVTVSDMNGVLPGLEAHQALTAERWKALAAAARQKT